ncbi:MAG: hypothetical protein AAGA90_01265 [Actinomycetota bacterium]
MIPELTRVAEADYLSGIATAPIDEIRSMRSTCADLENGTSFVRRLAQGRLDLLAEESKRRAEGSGGSLGALVDSLADTLSDGVRAPGSGRVDQELDPPDHVVGPLTAALDARIPPSVVTSVAELGDDELSAALIALRDFEEELSSARRSLHSTIDALNNELARRIAAGESPAGLG